MPGPKTTALQSFAAISELLAAIFWFWSAALDIPDPVAYWDHTPPSDGFITAIRFSSRLNQLAALSAGFSAACQAAATALAIRKPSASIGLPRKPPTVRPVQP
jgi:hypothetical protein